MLKLFATVTALASTVATAQAVEFERFELANGIRVLYVQVEDAPKQSTFTFLPLSLATDDAGCAQWSHLLEHMLIRSTDPHTLTPPGAMLNGETMHNSLRLETICEPDKCEENLRRHATWLTAREFDAATLVREKTAIEGEERFTAERGLTSKWAIAAWNQAVRHGADEVNIHSDVANAEIGDVQRYATSRIPINDSVMIASIGPVDPAAFREEIERVFADIASVEAEPARSDRPPAQLMESHTASWDMPTRHAMWWWRLPDDSGAVLASASCLARALRIRMHEIEDRETLFRTCEFYPAVSTPEGTFFIADVCLPPSVENEDQTTQHADKVWRLIRERLGELSRTGPKFVPVVFCGTMLVTELNLQPRFALMRRSNPLRADMIEASWMLQAAMTEFAWNKPVGELILNLWTVDTQTLEAIMQQFLEQAPGLLMLRPRTDDSPAEAPHAAP